ncbi:unnamed protein product [Discosporangium mesarthrocarpum]
MGDRTTERLYSLLPFALLPPGWREVLTARPEHKDHNNGSRGASAARLTTFLRGMLPSLSERAALSAIDSKLRKKALHLENLSAQTAARSASARTARMVGRERKGMSGKQLKGKGLHRWECHSSAGGAPLRFRDFLGLHDIWNAYMSRLIEVVRSKPKVLQQRLLKADLQGCYLTVARAAVASLVGVRGIVIEETSNTFKLITHGRLKLKSMTPNRKEDSKDKDKKTTAMRIKEKKKGHGDGGGGGGGGKGADGGGCGGNQGPDCNGEDQVKTVLKKGSVFRLVASCLKLEIHGEALCGRCPRAEEHGLGLRLGLGLGSNLPGGRGGSTDGLGNGVGGIQTTAL